VAAKDAGYLSPECVNKIAEKVAMFKLATGALIKVCTSDCLYRFMYIYITTDCCTSKW